MPAPFFDMDEATASIPERRRAWLDRGGAALAGAIAGAVAASWIPRPAATCAALAACSPLLVGAGALSGAGLMAAGRRAAGWRVLAMTGTALFLRPRATRAVVVGARSFEASGARAAICPLRLVTANLSNDTGGIGPVPEEITLAYPDLVVLQEVTPAHRGTLDELATRLGLIHSEVRANRGHAGLGVWSRFELYGAHWLDVAGEPQLWIWVDLPDGGRLRLAVVHAPSPVPQKVERWRSWFATMTVMVGSELTDHDDPLLMAGDFNATIDHRPFRRLLDAGLSDAAPDRWGGWPMTWSTRWWPLPPLFRIDHVLVSQGVQVARSRAGRAAGSDHRSLTVDIQQVRSSAAPARGGVRGDVRASSIPLAGGP